MRVFEAKAVAKNLKKPRSALALVLLLVYFSKSLWAVDPSTHISQYGHTAWRIQDGVFSGAPNAIAQTADGYLWIGTQNGLFRFDGVRFTASFQANGKLVSNGIFSLLGGADGSLWIGTGLHLARLKNGVLTNFTDHRGRVNTILKDHNGTVWIARSRVGDSDGPLCEVANSKLRCRGKADGITPSYAGPLIEDLERNLWFGSANVLTRWRAGSSAIFAPAGLKDAANVSGLQALAVTQDGSIWSGAVRTGHGLGLQQLSKGSWKPFAAPGVDGERLEVNALFVDGRDTLWVGTEDRGLYRIRAGKVEHFSSADGLSSDTVNAFFEDREGNLWIATSEGIDSFRDTPVLTFSIREGLSSNQANSVLAAADGTVWIGNHSSLDYLRDGKLNSVPRGAGPVTSLFEDHAGQLWVGIANGLYVYERGRFEKITGPKDGSIGTVLAITEDVDHSIWAETVGGTRKLLRIEGRIVREEFPATQIPRAVALDADPRGGIWLALFSGDGLARYRHGQIETFATGKTVNQIAVRSDGSVLGATAGGLVYWRNGTLKILTSQNGLPCENLFSLISAPDEGVWLYAECGILHVPDAELQKWWDDNKAVAKIESFDAFDGTRPSGTPFRPNASRSPDGRLWFANESVVQMIDPKRLHTNAIPPPVQIERLVADHKSYPLSPAASLPALTRDLEIDYTALSFAVPQKVRFRYKLEGHDPGWVDPQTRRQAFYNDLPPRKYRFRVIACNNNGVWNDIGTALDFSIAPAWFQTTWFFVLSGVGALMLVWSFIQVRTRQMQKSFGARFDERLAERTRIARELHDTLLQTLQGSKLVADDALENSSDPPYMRRAMQQLSDWLERATREGRAALDSLRASATQTNDLADAFKRATDESRMQSSMEATFSVVGRAVEMHPVVRDEIYRIGYEAIRNAYKHSNGKRIEVTLHYGRDLTVTVSDDGIGIDPVVAEQGKNLHFGLQGMRERASRIGGKLLILSSPNSGTEVKIAVPGRVIFVRPE
jgi:ligand-binding sensor domain-containing protein